MGNESQRRADLEEGIEKAREAERDLHKHPFSRPVTDAFGMYGFDQMGLGEDGKRAYEDFRGGKSISEIRQEFEDSLGEESKSSRKGVVSSGGGDSGGYRGRRSSDREWDKVYDSTWNEMGVGEKIGQVICTGIVGGLIAIAYGIILASLSLGIWYGVSSHINNKRIQPKIQVAKEHNLPARSLVDKIKWDAKGFRDNNKENAKNSLKSRMKRNRLSNELEENLDDLAGIILDNKGRFVKFRSYFQKENDVWVVGSYSSLGGGFICYSPDKGDTWFKQWSSFPKDQGGCKYDIPGAIHFFDQNEGWSFTMRRPLHTSDGGRNWKTTYISKNGLLVQYHILSRKNIILKEKVTSYEINKIIRGVDGRAFRVPQPQEKKVPYYQTVYTIDGGRKWKTIDEWKPEFFNLLKLPKDSKSRGFYLYNELISKKPDYISERVID